MQTKLLLGSPSELGLIHLSIQTIFDFINNKHEIGNFIENSEEIQRNNNNDMYNNVSSSHPIIPQLGMIDDPLFIEQSSSHLYPYLNIGKNTIVKMSIIELYNDNINDLLSTNSYQKQSKQNLRWIGGDNTSSEDSVVNNTIRYSTNSPMHYNNNSTSARGGQNSQEKLKKIPKQKDNNIDFTMLNSMNFTEVMVNDVETIHDVIKRTRRYTTTTTDKNEADLNVESNHYEDFPSKRSSNGYKVTECMSQTKSHFIVIFKVRG